MRAEQLIAIKGTVATLTAQVDELTAEVGTSAPVDSNPVPVDSTPAPVEAAPVDSEAKTLSQSEAQKMVADAVAVKDMEIADLKVKHAEFKAMIAAKYEEMRVVDNNGETGFAALLAQSN